MGASPAASKCRARENFTSSTIFRQLVPSAFKRRKSCLEETPSWAAKSSAPKEPKPRFVATPLRTSSEKGAAPISTRRRLRRCCSRSTGCVSQSLENRIASLVAENRTGAPKKSWNGRVSAGLRPVRCTSSGFQRLPHSHCMNRKQMPIAPSRMKFAPGKSEYLNSNPSIAVDSGSMVENVG